MMTTVTSQLLVSLVFIQVCALSRTTAAVNYTLCNNTADVVRLELWEKGWVSASASGVTNERNGFKVNQTPGSKVNQTPEVSCKLPLVACDACRLNISVSSLQLPVCQDANISLTSTPELPTCLPGCSHVVIYEPSYSDVTTHFLFPSSMMTSYTSLSSSAVFMLCHPDGMTSQSKVTFHFEVIEKKTQVTGSAADPGTRQGVLQSPNFPRGYAIRGEIYTYVLRAADPGGGVRVVFDDWDLAPHSRVMFYTNISSHSPVGTFFGSGPRPLLLVPGQVLYMTFEPDVGLTSRANNMGFQATYTFLTDSGSSDAGSALTDCGLYYRYVAGGNITFHRAHQGAVWDCVWVVTPHSAFDWVLLRLVNLSLTDNLVLTVRSGVTSDCPLVANISSTGNGTFPMTTQYEGRDGFYIRLQGFVSGTDLLSVVFAAFNRVQAGGCAHAGEFECLSGHCIDSHLACDGHLHCDDGHDEGIACKLSPAELSTLHLVCKVTEFSCANGRRCLPLSAVCDTWLDCQDGSDEYMCSSQTSTHMPAGSGELGESEKCEEGTQLCHHGRQCVALSGLCDGRYDCWDRSDEMHCTLSFETSMTRPAPWRLVMPLGIALCVLLSLCVLALCIRTFVKQDGGADCGSRSSTRSSSNQSRCTHRSGSHGDAHRPRSVTSETPLTLDLSRSTSGMTVESAMPDSPPSYEEAMRRSPEGATETSTVSESGNRQVSPSVLSPPAYHIPITGKQHFTFSLWPLSSSNSSTKQPQHRHLEEANVQLLASEFNSSSGASEPGSTVGLNTLTLTEDTAIEGASSQSVIGSSVVDIERAGSALTEDTLSIGTVTTCSSVTVRESDSRLSHYAAGSFRELSPDGSTTQRNYRTPSVSSRGSSHEGGQKACHCHCRGHDSRRLAHKRTRSRHTGCDSKGCPPRMRQRSVCACSLTDVQLNEICVKNRNAKDTGAACDSQENESLLTSDADSPLLCDVDDDDVTSCDEREAYGRDVPSLLTTDVQCLVHENAFCDTVC